MNQKFNSQNENFCFFWKQFLISHYNQYFQVQMQWVVIIGIMVQSLLRHALKVDSLFSIVESNFYF